jgi:hypothetical protein
MLWWTQGYVKISNANEFEHVVKCGKLQCWSNILGNYVRDVDICTQAQYSIIETIWIFVDKFRTQIILPSQFVEFLEYTKTLL